MYVFVGLQYVRDMCNRVTRIAWELYSEHSVTSHLLPFCRLNDVLEFAEDYECDVPKFWDYIAELLTPSVAHKGFPLVHLKQAHEGPLESGKIGKLVAKILRRCTSLEVSTVADSLSSLSHVT